MAKKFGLEKEAKKKRKGIHSKNNSSNRKNSRNYKKKYKGQGR
jgi:hypothetical protein